ncbi:hypothetical protein [Uliginosibacterium gangwonense]|uniref:hypothetical protein n=1 Tax=Uliginosibacterium gangwonense TaxID=392736 RepID=UPI00037D50FC|nr:hypothetical protein [Uliginosibacterium gangwonense]
MSDKFLKYVKKEIFAPLCSPVSLLLALQKYVINKPANISRAKSHNSLETGIKTRGSTEHLGDFSFSCSKKSDKKFLIYQ